VESWRRESSPQNSTCYTIKKIKLNNTNDNVAKVADEDMCRNLKGIRLGIFTDLLSSVEDIFFKFLCVVCEFLLLEAFGFWISK